MEFLSSINLHIVFAAIGGIGFLFLAVTLIVGDVFDAVGVDLHASGGDGGFGALDSRVLSVFLTAFGGFGLIAAWTGYGALASSLFGLLGGIIFGGVVSAFGKFLISQQSSSSVTDKDILGRTAQVTVGIKPGELGQVTMRIGDERVEKLARSNSDEEIKNGAIVKVSAIAGDSVLVKLEE